MPFSDDTCRKIAERVKEENDNGATDVHLDRHEQMFVSMVENRKSKSKNRRILTLGAACVLTAAAAAVLLVFVPFSSPDTLEFTIGDDGKAGESGDWIETGQEVATKIYFLQGSNFSVEKNSAARIVQSDEEAVTIELSKGEMKVRVRGNNKTRWKVNAGPFTVGVLGTEFRVKWDTEGSALEVDVKRGVVLVQGGGVSHNGIKLTAGQTLSANGRSGEVLVNSLAKMENQDHRVEAVERAPTRAKYIGKSPKSQEATPVWLSHMESDRFNEAIGAAEQHGLKKIFATTSLENLWRLAEAARNSGRPAISNNALMALRKRYKGSRKAKLAAFIIGRSAMDKSNNPAVATEWFNTYLSESPRGSVAEEAYRRLMTLHSQMGRADSAARIANKYLSIYPNGLYTDRAKHVLDQ